MDLTGVSVSDLVRVYFQLVDPSRQVVVCPEVVADGRLVSVRSRDRASSAALEQLLARVGYETTEQAGVTYVCPSLERQRDKAVFPVAGELPGPGSASMGGGVLGSLYPTMNAAYAAMELGVDPTTSGPVDRLVQAGWMFAGCVGAPGVAGGAKVLLRSQDQGVTFSLDEVRRSHVSVLAKCGA